MADMSKIEIIFNNSDGDGPEILVLKIRGFNPLLPPHIFDAFCQKWVIAIDLLNFSKVNCNNFNIDSHTLIGQKH